MKLFSIGILIGSAALISTPLGFIATVVILFLLIVLSKITLKEFYPSVRSFRFLIIFTILIQSFFAADGSFTSAPTKESLINAFFVTLRFSLIIAFSALYTITTTPADIARSLYVFVKPFKALKMNVNDAAVSILVAIRFIPLLFEESDKIITAQKLRGIWTADTGFKDKFKFFTTAEAFIIPLFMRILHYAEQVSITLCYRKNLDEVMRIPPFKTYDMIFFIFSIIFAGLIYALW